MITVLVLASSPKGEGQLQLGKEHKQINHSLNSAKNRDQFRVVSCMATTIDDLRNYLIEHSPTIVHFSGHGAGNPGLCFEDEQGFTNPVPGEKLAKLFHLVNDTVQCVVLNACLSEVQANAISEHIDFVVGMKEEIGDDAALKFSQGFYAAIWGGRTYDKAFKFGCSAIDTAGIPEDHIPVLKMSPRLGGTSLPYSEETQSIENFILGYMNGDAEHKAKLTIDSESHVAEFRERERTPKQYQSVTVNNISTLSGDFKEVGITLRSKGNSADRVFYLKNQGSSYLVDWAATTGRWPMPFTTFKALGSKTPLCVRVAAQLGDIYICGFHRYSSVCIRLFHISGDKIFGYIEKTNEFCDELVRLLYDGKIHRLIVEIQPVNGDTDCVLITDLISSDWIMPED